MCTGVKIINKNYIQKKYNWSDIQKDYIDGMSYRDITKKYGVTPTAISRAKKRGDLITRTLSEAGFLTQKKYGPNIMGIAARKQLSKRMSEHNPGGKSKWFTVAGKKVQGTWERDFALFLEEKSIKWERCKPWKYIISEQEKRYTPDFYLPERDLFVEIKGYWWGNDKEKMVAVIAQYPNRNILIIEDIDFANHIK